MRANNQTYCVSCPNCGRISQKSRETDSVIVCGKCKYEFYVYLKNGVSVSMSIDKMKSQPFYGRFRSFAVAIDDM